MSAADPGSPRAAAVRYRAEDLRALTEHVFQARGLTDEHARISADVLIDTELRGIESHGLISLERYARRLAAGTIHAGARPRVAGGRGAAIVVDGEFAQGQVTAHLAMSEAIARAREHGLAAAAVRRSTHYGAAGYFARMASAAGMIGAASTNSGALVAPWQGRQPVYGTNPLAFAIPAGAYPDIVLDFATSMIAEGKMHIARWKGESIPDDWVLGGATDPTIALAQPMLPFGRYKGSGLALVAEMLSAALPLAKLSTELARVPSPIPGERREGRGVGHFFLAIDVTAFAPLEEFRARVDEMIREVKAVPPADGYSEVLVAGEPEARAKLRNERLGVPLMAPLVDSLRRLAEETGFPFPRSAGG